MYKRIASGLIIFAVGFVWGGCAGAFHSSKQINAIEQGIANDCLTKNGFELNGVTYLCQPIVPQQ
jgi:hypothetical protein